MKQFEYYYGLSPVWYKQLAAKEGVTIKEDKILIIPDAIGKGSSFFVEVIPGMSVLLLDLVLTAPVKIKHLGSQDDLYIINFDISEEVNVLQINGVSYKVGCMANLGLFVWKNTIENTYEHAVGKRIFTIRLIVDQKLLSPLLANIINPNGSSKNKDTFDKKELYFYDLIDSNSRILIDAIKQKSVFSPHFDFYLKGIALKLLGNFIHRYSDAVPVSQGVKKIDLEALEFSKKYLLRNLKKQVPRNFSTGRSR